MAFDILLFLHLAGIIVGLGAVTVIDVLGFRSRNDASLTQMTIYAHHTTKPLIWIGTGLIVLSWAFMLWNRNITTYELWKTGVLGVMILNGMFLSFWLSPRLDQLSLKKSLVPKHLQAKIIASMTISFISWWSFVFLTVLALTR